VRIVTVLRSGGEYGPKHVAAIERMVGPVTCITDMEVSCGEVVPMESRWPGWWAKMEVCRPDMKGPLLFLDLDTVVTGSLDPLLADASRSVVLRDFYRGRTDRSAVQSALMLLTERDRADVWAAWRKNPQGWMRRARSDQDVYEAVLRGRALFWQDTHPGMVLGFKTDIVGGVVPEDARVVCFHGKPRPWRCGQEWAEAWWS
jgi:hypothetical protein